MALPEFQGKTLVHNWELKKPPISLVPKHMKDIGQICVERRFDMKDIESSSDTSLLKPLAGIFK